MADSRETSPSPDEIRAAEQAVLDFQRKSSIKADLRGLVTAALVAAARARRRKRSRRQ